MQTHGADTAIAIKPGMIRQFEMYFRRQKEGHSVDHMRTATYPKATEDRW